MLKTKTKQLAILIATLLLPSITFAANQINLGTLDLRLTNNQEEINLNVEPGKTYQQEIQISNFSGEKMDLEITSKDAKQENKEYLVQSNKETSSFVNKWIKLPANKISLNSGEGKIMSVNISIPELAPIGEQTAAILVTQKTTTDENIINIEKGIRVKLNILGEANSIAKNIYTKLNTDQKSINLKRSVLNNGNTKISGTLAIKNIDANNQVTAFQKTDFFLLPGEEETINLQVPKPVFGFQRTMLEENLGKETRTSVLQENFYLPEQTGAVLILFVFITLAILTSQNKFSGMRSSTWKSLASFLTLAAISFVFTQNTDLNNQTKSNVLNTESETGYLTTIKWGNSNNQIGNSKLKTNWKGKFKIDNSRLIITDFLHKEKNDKLYLNSTEDTLLYENNTGPDNDGVVLFIKPTLDSEQLYLNYFNSYSKEESRIALNRTLNKEYSINYKGQKITITTVEAPATISFNKNGQTATLNTKDYLSQADVVIDSSSTTENTTVIDQDITPEIAVILPTSNITNNIELQNEISLLRDVIADLPVSSEVLTEYIFNSDYVEEVKSENNTSTIKADPALISVLKDTPLTIQEISQTPELNFVFLPNEKIKLSPQIFSFEKSTTSTQDFGEILFSQNRTSNWNAYMSVSDFVSVSGRGSITADNISINPGLVKVLSQDNSATVEAGTIHKLNNSSDQAVLVFVQPQDSNQTIFTLKPQISLNIPAQTPPGLYRGEITIRII